MTQAQNRSLCLALGRLRFAIVTSCWVIAFSLVAQLIVWSLCSFTEMRYTDDASADSALVADGGDKKPSRSASRDKGKPEARWRPETADEVEDTPAVGTIDRIFKVAVTVARTMGLMCALVICPLLSLGVLLAVPAGAPKVERAVNALFWAIVLVLLAMPLGGWFGMAWQQGTITDYHHMILEVEAARAETFSPVFYSRFLLLPAASAVGFILVGFQFSSAVVAVLVKRNVFDAELEKEASNVAATSLHGTAGRTAGALSKALEADKKKKARAQQSMSRMSPGEMPKRLI